MTPAAAPRPGLKAILRRLRGRPDSEHEMSFNRVAFTLFALAMTWQEGLDPVAVPVLIGSCVVSVLVFVHLLIRERPSVTRRVLMMIVDLSTISYFMHVNDSYSAGFWPLLLWTSLGNGFRFGTEYLFAATFISLLTFGAVVATTPFWHEHMSFTIGMGLGLLALPLYAATLIRKLSRATADAEEASRAKSYFLASVSHELRTPLTAIIGLGAHLHASETDGERRQMADTIVSAGRSLLGLINRLLDYSRIEARGGIAEAKPFDIAKLLVGVRELMRFQTAEKGLTLNVHLAADTPLMLLGDETHLRDILVNLVGNALKFTETGAITIVGGTERDAAGRLMLRLTVADTGIGIAPEAQDHIFGSFRQADDTIIDRFGGTGLGLAICKQLAEVMGGTIGVASEPGRGSRFSFIARVEAMEEQPIPARHEARLLLFSDDPELARSIGRGVVRRDARAEMRGLYDPEVASIVLTDARTVAAQGLTPPDLAQSLERGAVAILLSDDASANNRADIAWTERGYATCIPRDADAATLDHAISLASALAGEAAGRLPKAQPARERMPRRILVADDNQMNQKVFGMILGRAGHEVASAGDGEAALNLMKDHGFDVVLMDVNMPVLNGIEATKLYRFAALGQRHVPIVGVTADASAATAERCLDAGMDACVAKPVEAEVLLDLIDSLVGAEIGPGLPQPLAHDPAGVVTPLFREDAPSIQSPVDWRSLQELEELGGREFVVDLLQVYLGDADALLEAVSRAVAEGDVAEFRANAHALRSSAANVGAQHLAELCLHYQRVSEAEFARSGARHRDALAAELARVGAALTDQPRWREAAVAG